MVDAKASNEQGVLHSDGTPQLTINHDVAAELDSSNAFEGPEKLLEVWFAPSPASLPPGAKANGLKAVAADTWVGMLDEVNCKILSVLESDTVDAYLLSESSLFVFPHKLILKTCGTTTLLLGLDQLLRIAAEHAGFPSRDLKSSGELHAPATPYRVFYSRKNFLFPDRQRGPHRSWKDEVKYLDDKFEGGSAYLVGKMNGDHWYLYITGPSQALTPPLTPEADRRGEDAERDSKLPTVTTTDSEHLLEGPVDETLEILMTDLEPENAKRFYLDHASAVATKLYPARVQEARRGAHTSLGDLSGSAAGADHVHENQAAIVDAEEANRVLAEALTTEGHALGTVVSDSCGLSDIYPTSLYPEARVDAYLFSPCGFSANGVIPAPARVASPQSDGAHYFTVHVTPEPNCSFASFETNVPGGQGGRTTAEIIEHVVSIFKPGRFSVTLFEAKGQRGNPYGVGLHNANPEAATGQRPVDPISGYRRIDRSVHDFDDYGLVFRFYEREGWTGDRAARVGEML